MILTTNLKGVTRSYTLGQKNLVVGPNGAGKSALVDSLALVLTGEAASHGLGKSWQTLGPLAYARDDITIRLAHEDGQEIASWVCATRKRPVWNKPAVETAWFDRAFFEGLLSGEKLLVGFLRSFMTKKQASRDLTSRRPGWSSDLVEFLGQADVALKDAQAAHRKAKGGQESDPAAKAVAVEWYKKHGLPFGSKPVGLESLLENRGGMLRALSYLSTASEPDVIDDGEPDTLSEEDRLIYRALASLLDHLADLGAVVVHNGEPRPCPCCREKVLTLSDIAAREKAIAEVLQNAPQAVRDYLENRKQTEIEAARHLNAAKWAAAVEATPDDVWSSVVRGSSAPPKIDLIKLQADVEEAAAMVDMAWREAVEAVSAARVVLEKRINRFLPVGMVSSVDISEKNGVEIMFYGMAPAGVTDGRGAESPRAYRALSGAERASAGVAIGLAQLSPEWSGQRVLVVDDIWFDSSMLRRLLNAIKAGQEDKGAMLDLAVVCAVELKGKAPKGWTEVTLSKEPGPTERKRTRSKKAASAEDDDSLPGDGLESELGQEDGEPPF